MVSPVSESDLSSSEPLIRWSSLVRALLVMSLVLLAAFPAIGGWGYWSYGKPGLITATVAGLSCWVGGVLGFAVSLPFQGLQAVNGVLAGMLVRMTVPMVVALGLLMSRSELLGVDRLPLLVVYYLVALVVDTILSVRAVQNAARGSSRLS